MKRLATAGLFFFVARHIGAIGWRVVPVTP